MFGLDIEACADVAFGQGGALVLSARHRAIRDSLVVDVTATAQPGAVIQTGGSGNRFERIVSIDGNPEAKEKVALAVDRGDGNSFSDLSLAGDHHMAAFLRKLGDGQVRVERLCGVPEGEGLIFADAGAPLPEGDLTWTSDPVDPGNSAAFFTAREDSWILGIRSCGRRPPRRRETGR